MGSAACLHAPPRKPAAGELPPVVAVAQCLMQHAMPHAACTTPTCINGQPGTKPLHQPVKLSKASTLPCRASPYLHNLVGQPLVVLLLDANVAEIDVVLAMGIKPSRDEDQVGAAGRKGVLTALGGQQQVRRPSIPAVSRMTSKKLGLQVVLATIEKLVTFARGWGKAQQILQ